MSYDKKSDVGKLASTRFVPGEKNSAVVMSDRPSSLTISKDQAASIRIVDERAASISVVQEMKASMPVSQERKASIPVTSEHKASMPVTQEMKQSVSVTSEHKASMPVTHEMKQSMPVTHEQKASMPVTWDMKQSIPVTQEMKASMPVTQEMKASMPVTQEMKTSLPIHTQQLTGVEIFGADRAEQYTLKAMDTKAFGFNSVVSPEFKVDEAVNMQCAMPEGGISAGYRHTLDTSSDSYESGSMTNDLFTGLNQDACILGYLALGAMDVDCAITEKTVPATVSFDLSSIGSRLSANIASGETAKIMFPNATILAPIRAGDNTSDVGAEGNYSVGPIYVPFVLMCESSTTLSRFTTKFDTAVTETPTGLFDATGVAAVNAGPDIDISPLPAVYSTSARIADVQLKKFMVVNSVNTPVDCITYSTGWEYTYSTVGNNDMLSGHTLTLELVPVSDFMCSDEDGKYNGNGYVQAKVTSVTDGSSDYTLLEDVNVYYANSDYSIGGILTTTGMNYVTERDNHNQAELSLAGTSYKRYSFDVSGADITLYLTTVDYTGTDRYFIGADLPVTPGSDTTNFYIPENLPYVYGDLPATSTQLELQHVQVLRNSSNYIAVRVRYNDTETLVVARRGRSFSGSAFLSDDGERNAWVLSQYVVSGGRVMDYDPTTGYSDDGYFTNQSIGDEVSGNVASVGVITNRKRVSGQLFTGTEMFLDQPKAAAFSRTFMYGHGSPVYLPFAADRAVYGFTDMATFGASSICIPLMLPSIAVIPGGVTPSDSSSACNTAALRWGLLHTACNMTASHSHTVSGYKASSGATRRSCAGRGTVVMISTTPLASGRAYANLPPTLESIVGYDPVVDGVMVGSEYFAGAERTLTPSNGGLYYAARYQLNAMPGKRALNTSGEHYMLGSNLFVVSDTGLSVYSIMNEYGIQHITTAACTVLSNFVRVAGAVVFVATDGIYAFAEQRVVRIYEFSSDVSAGTVGILTGAGAFVYTYGASSGVVCYVIDNSLGVYKSTTTAALSSYTPTLFDDAHTPEIVMTYCSAAGTSWSVQGLITATAGGTGSVESNNAIVERGKRPFVLTAMDVYFERGSTATAPFKVTIYTEGGQVYANTSIGTAFTGMNQMRFKTGIVECSTLRWKLYDIADDVVIHDVRMIGYYSNEIV